MTTTRLHKQPAPAYWSRYTVTTTEGRALGRIERRGGFSPWYALDHDGHLLGTFAHRPEAVEAVVERDGYTEPVALLVPARHDRGEGTPPAHEHRPWEV